MCTKLRWTSCRYFMLNYAFFPLITPNHDFKKSYRLLLRTVLFFPQCGQQARAADVEN